MSDDQLEADTAEGMTADELQRLGKKWLERIRDAEKRDDDEWAKDAKEATAAYLNRKSGVEGKVYDFNIFHSNIETIAPAIYNSTPVPDIRERFRTGNSTPETAAARVCAQIIERAIAVQIDDGAMDSEIEAQVQDALVAGRGVMRVRFDADEREMPAQIDPMSGMEIQPAQVMVENERLKFEVVSWCDYREGPAQRWEDVPWVAYCHSLPQEQIDRIQDEELKRLLSDGGMGEEEQDGETVKLWEVWDKETRKVLMIIEASGEIIKLTDDPMGLKGFFPQAEPLQPITASGRRMPVVPFSIYRALCDELEIITDRIVAITDGLKVRGFIIGNSEDWEKLAEAGDNELIPIANLEALAQTGGIERAIAWWPVDRAIQVLQQLYLNRETTKNMIYEITGISDIVRGQGNASETATAQNIKSQWGSLRIKKLQRMIERGVRDLFVICAEVISSKFSPMTLQKMTGIEITQDVAAMLGKPLDNYRIDVESDSTVRADLSRQKGEMGEFLQGTAGFFQAMAPLIQGAPELAGPVSQIYASFARQFNLGKQAEDAVEQMAEMAAQQAQQAKQMQAQQQQMQQEAMQKEQAREDAKTQAEVGSKQAQAQIAMGKLQIEGQRLVLDERKAEIEALSKLSGDYENGGQ